MKHCVTNFGITPPAGISIARSDDSSLIRVFLKVYDSANAPVNAQRPFQNKTTIYL